MCLEGAGRRAGRGLLSESLRRNPRSIRLTGKKSFDLAFAGKRVSTPDLVFYCRPNGTDRGRAGLVIGKKAYAGAVTRNHLKRWLRDLFRRNLDCLRGYDVVVVAKRGRPMPEYAMLGRQMKKLAMTLEGK